MLNKDTLMTAILAGSGGKQAVKYDDKGKPSVMVRIPLFNLQDIDAALGTGPHPAFIVNGEVKNEIYIGAYQAVVDEGRACSLPGVLPTGNYGFDAAKKACVDKGPGWHMMTAWEWAAIALWCLKNGFQPRGNTRYGLAYGAAWETGVRTDGRAPGESGGTPRALAGSGPASWRHDNTFAGIADLVGNIWEWNDGLFMRDGRLYFPPDNNFAAPETDWPASAVFLDAATGPIGGEASAENGNVVLSSTITHYTETPAPAGGGDNRDITYASNAKWMDTALAATYDALPEAVRQRAAQLLIAPKLKSTDEKPLFADIKGNITSRNYGTRFPIRGGGCSNPASEGLGALGLSRRRTAAESDVGFRPAFIL
jgi:hypothetical protein